MNRTALSKLAAEQQVYLRSEGSSEFVVAHVIETGWLTSKNEESYHAPDGTVHTVYGSSGWGEDWLVKVVGEQPRKGNFVDLEPYFRVVAPAEIAGRYDPDLFAAIHIECDTVNAAIAACEAHIGSLVPSAAVYPLTTGGSTSLPAVQAHLVERQKFSAWLDEAYTAGQANLIG